METESFEDKIKRQLQDREITPSARAWEQLSVKLDATQNKKKPFVFWLGIAASIISGILILSLVFNNSAPSESPQIVDVPKDEVKVEKGSLETSEEIFTQIQDEATQVAASEMEKESITPKSNIAVPPVKQIQQKNREAVAAIDNESLLKEQTLITPSALASDKILDLELNNALANVLTQTNNGQLVTDEEVNKLLAEAASKISQERYKTNFATGEVNPQDLLRDVEFEMDNSFRDKIFEMLKEGYSKAKTAVANRNY